MDWRHTGRFCVAAFLMDFATGVFFVALPFLVMSLSGTSMDLGLVGSLRGGGYVVACAIVASLCDRYDRRILIGLAGIALTVTYLLLAGSFRLWHVYACSLAWAFAIAPYWPSMFSWIGDSHDPQQLGTATGAVNMSWSLGNLFGGMLGGWLFTRGPAWPFAIALAPTILACVVMVRSPCPHRTSTARSGGVPQPGDKRILASAWLGTVSVCAMLGLIGGVFPELGKTMGIGPALFGLLVGGEALGRTAMFIVAFRWSRWIRDWRVGVGAQAAVAIAVATISPATATPWIAAVFLVAGVAMGICYYRGLYHTLEAPGARGRRAGIFEACVLGGVLLGTLGGGWAADTWGLRTPYVPMGCAAAVLALLQVVLVASAGKSRRRA